MRLSRTFVIVSLILCGSTMRAAEIRAEFTSSHPDRWLWPEVVSRTALNSTQALHSKQGSCPGNQDVIYSHFQDSYWITPAATSDPIIFVMTNVDPLEIIDFYVGVSACVNGVNDYSHPLVTATLRLFKDGALISERQVGTRNCFPDPATGCVLGRDASPYIGSYPPSAIPPTIRFAPDTTLDPTYRRIMNRTQVIGGYPSPYQARLVGAPSVADVSGMIEVELLLDGADGSPAAGVDVYLRPIDPPDPAPYRTDRRKGDNKDTIPASITGAPGYEFPVPGSTATVFRTDSAGKIYARLHGSTREAGDNYRVRASLYRAVAETEECSRNNMKAPCFESDIFTVWKRALIEKDHMIRVGTFLQQRYSGGTQVKVVKTSAFNPAAGATLAFMHGSRGTSNDYSEVGTIASYKNGVITLTQPLAMTYEGPDNNGSGPAHTADAVAVWGSGFFDVSLAPLRDGLLDAYIDVQEIPQSSPYFPYVAQISEQIMLELAVIWQTGQADDHLIAARLKTTPSFGTTQFSSSYVWVQQCINYTSANDPLRHEVAAHEVIHRWRVNNAFDATRLSDHCDLNAYPAASTKRCTMHTYYQQGNPPSAGAPISPEFRDGIVQFHYVINGAGVADSEYLGLRSKDGVQ